MKYQTLDRLSVKPCNLPRELNKNRAPCLEKGAEEAHAISHSLKQNQGKQPKREELEEQSSNDPHRNRLPCI